MHPHHQQSTQNQGERTGGVPAGAARRSRNNRSRNNRSRNNRSRHSGYRGRDERGYQGVMHSAAAAALAHHSSPTGIPVPEQQQQQYVLPNEVPEIPKTFYCQLAHGGPTAVIPTPNNLKEVYQEIASKFDGMSPDDILYCTVNTFKADMDNLLTTNLKSNDFIFAHCRGTRKEVTLTKMDAIVEEKNICFLLTENKYTTLLENKILMNVCERGLCKLWTFSATAMLGVTLTDNGYGKVFIKRIHSDSVAARSQPAVCVGDHIEKVNGQSVVGTRHFNVAAALRAIPVGESFTLRLVEPQQSGFSFVGPRKSGSTSSNASTSSKKGIENAIQDGNQTLRFRANGNAVMQEAPSQAVVDKINDIFETYLGFNDDVLALAGWEIASKAKNYVDLKNLFADSDLGGFGFPDELYFDIWGAVDDYRKKRLPTEEAESGKSLTAASNAPTKNE